MIVINALARGGFSVFGGWYEPRSNVVMVQAAPGESVNLSATFPTTINTVDVVTYGGVTAADPTISGDSMTFTLTNFNAAARVRYDVMLSTGEMLHLNLEVVGSRAGVIGDAGGDYGDFVV